MLHLYLFPTLQCPHGNTAATSVSKDELFAEGCRLRGFYSASGVGPTALNLSIVFVAVKEGHSVNFVRIK